MAYSHDMLIDQLTGELDWSFIKRHALVRADREFGGPGAPASYVRPEITYLKDIANEMRKRWRAARGLPNDTPTTMMMVPAWGASGDSFGAR